MNGRLYLSVSSDAGASMSATFDRAQDARKHCIYGDLPFWYKRKFKIEEYCSSKMSHLNYEISYVLCGVGVQIIETAKDC